MIRKLLISILCISVSLCCLPVFSSAQEVVHYASIPRPISTSEVKYIIADNATQTYPTIYRISNNVIAGDSIKYFFAVDGEDVKLYAYNYSGISASVFIDRFNLSGELLNSYSFNVPDGGVLNAIVLLNFDKDYVSFLDIGDIPLQEGSSFSSYGLPSIAWADSTDPDTYNSWLQKINSKLNDININAEDIDSKLLAIDNELSYFVQIFDLYKSSILGDTADLIELVDSVLKRLQLFQNQNHTDLVNIYNKLVDIYNILSEESETYSPVEQESEINDYLEAESALNKDFSGDLQDQFNVAGNIFTNNSAYAFISNSFQELILSNVKINAMIIFALAIGLCVLILGRRLNA